MIGPAVAGLLLLDADEPEVVADVEDAEAAVVEELGLKVEEEAAAC